VRQILVKKQLRGINVNQYFELFWRESGAGFYGPWLTKLNNKQVSVGSWGSGSFLHKFSGEVFTMKRTVTFTFPRTTHLYVGPPTAEVTQVQLARIDERNRCVLVMTIDMTGIPFADVFSVEMRWTADNGGEGVMDVQCGIQVVLHKYSLVSGKIKSGTIEESTPAQLDLVESMQKRIDEIGEVGRVEGRRVEAIVGVGGVGEGVGSGGEVGRRSVGRMGDDAVLKMMLVALGLIVVVLVAVVVLLHRDIRSLTRSVEVLAESVVFAGVKECSSVG